MAASDNTFSEALQKILSQVAQASSLPDADLQFCATMQAAIVQQLRQGSAQVQQAQQLQANPGMQMPPSAAGGPMMGLTPGPTDMDEIRRMVGSSQAQ